MYNPYGIKLAQFGGGVHQLGRSRVPSAVNIRDSISRIPQMQPPSLEKRQQLQRAHRAMGTYAPAHRSVQEHYRQMTFDNQPKSFFLNNPTLYKTPEGAPVNPYSSTGTQHPLQAMQPPASAWSRYRGTGDGYSRFNPYTGGGLSLVGGAAGAGIASRLGRSALMGGLGGGLLGLGLYAGGKYLYNKRRPKSTGGYSHGEGNEYSNADPRVWSRYNPPTRYDANKKVYRTDSQQMKNIGGSQIATGIGAGIGGLGGLALAGLLGVRGGLGRGVLALGGAGAGLYSHHQMNRPGSWYDRNRDRITRAREFLDIEGSSPGRNVRSPESYNAGGGS
jgi:hypothetical protein